MRRLAVLLLAITPVLAAAPSWDGSVASIEDSRSTPVVSLGGMVVAEDRVAASFGAEILKLGGNAVDAAVATTITMSVTRPQYASLGGGGFMLICFTGKPCAALDLREVAPAAAGRDFFVRDGKARTDLSQDGALASGVPGLPAGLFAALETYGSVPRARLFARAIALAKNGTPLSTRTEDALDDRFRAFNPEARRVFGCGGKPCSVGTVIRQPDLARVLEALAKDGAAPFYTGAIAKQIVDGIRAAGGALTLDDFARYRPRWRTPLEGSFGGLRVVTMPPPSAGGFVLLETLGYVERAARAGQLRGPDDPETLHAEAHAMALAFADRATWAGDPEFTDVPVAALLDPGYLDRRWATFDAAHAAIPAAAGAIDVPEGRHTTHVSVIDRQGNAVAFTLTINDAFGSGFVPPGTGIVMNDELDDFSIEPGVPNLYGLVGSEANAVAPGKRPLSSMVPTIVRDADGRTRLVLGASGGPRITTSVALVLVRRLHFGMSIADAVAAPRIHHQWKPAALRYERWGFNAPTLAALETRGWPLEPVAKSAIIHALERFPNGRTWGVPDPRGEGAAVAE